NPTLKAALDTYAAESKTSDDGGRAQLVATISNELHKVATRFDSDALVLVDGYGAILAAAGRYADRWPAGQIAVLGTTRTTDFDGVVPRGNETFRIVTVPLIINDGTMIGTLYLATSLDRRYAEELKTLARTETAIVIDGVVLATTLPSEAAQAFESF